MSFKQKTQSDTQTFVCIINVNSSYYEKESINSHSSFEKESNKSSIVRQPLRISSKCYNRVTPSCLRNRCQRRYHYSHRNLNGKVHHHHTYRSRMNLRETRPPVCEHKKNTNKLLSPISFPFKDDLDYLYEDISTDSFERIVEKPLSYKNGNNHICKRRTESKLDTLIRRTKERERRLVEESRMKRWYTMSPGFCSNVSSEECLYSSISDVSTFILGRRQQESDKYTCDARHNFAHEKLLNSHDKCPNFTYEKCLNFSQEKCQNFSQETCQNIKTEVNNTRNYPYSTSSTKDEPKYENSKIKEFKSEPIDNYDVKIGVKSEPMVDLETYSPIPDYFPSISAKLEPKFNPNMTCIDDGIAMAGYDD